MMTATRPARPLTPTERRTVDYIAEGLTTEEIAEREGVSRYTVRDRIRRIRALVNSGTMLDLPEATRDRLWSRVGS
jgi:DNA-binding CsgD family transcriptional regulator